MMRSISLVSLVSLVSLGGALTACGLEPDVGALLAGACEDADTDPDATVSYTRDIRPMVTRPLGQPGCSCHLPVPAGNGLGIALSGLNLGSLSSLRAGGLTSGSSIVSPGAPCASVFYQKVSDAPPFGSRMPLGGPPFWSREDIALLHDWIAEGAREN
jgi:hypothetical protein